MSEVLQPGGKEQKEASGLLDQHGRPLNKSEKQLTPEEKRNAMGENFLKDILWDSHVSAEEEKKANYKGLNDRQLFRKYFSKMQAAGYTEEDSSKAFVQIIGSEPSFLKMVPIDKLNNAPKKYELGGWNFDTNEAYRSPEDEKKRKQEEAKKSTPQAGSSGLVPPEGPKPPTATGSPDSNGDEEVKVAKGMEKAYKNIESGDELIEAILKNEGADKNPYNKWGSNGECPLFEIVNGEKVPNLHNYRRWYREKIFYICNDINPNSNVNLWSGGASGIEIKISGAKNYNMGVMLNEPKAWRFKQKVTDEKTGKVVVREVDFNDTLKGDIETDVFEANKFHNTAISLKNARSKEFAGTYLSEMNDNIWAGGSGLSALYHRSDTSKEETDKMLSGDNYNGRMGQAARIATLGYYYLGESVANEDMYKDGAKNMFEEVMGKDGLDAFWGKISEQLMKQELLKPSSDPIRESIRKKIKSIEEANKDKPEDQRENWMQLDEVKEAMKKAISFSGDDMEWNQLWKNKKGLTKEIVEKIKGVDLGKGKSALTVFNFFSQVQPSGEYMKLVREGMTAAIQKKTGVDQFTAKYADFLTSKTWDVLGMYGNNDVETGFSLAGRYKNILAYRMKNAGPSANLEKAGNRWNLFDIKQMYVDPIQGLNVRVGGKDNDTRSLLSVLQGGQCDNFDVNSSLEKFDFKQDALRQYASDHMINAEKVGAELMKTNGFAYLAKGLEFNEKGEIEWGDDWYEKVTDLWHNLRYSYKNPAFKYDQKVQVPVLDTSGKLVGYEIKTLAESIFSKELIDMGMSDKAGTDIEDAPETLSIKEKKESFPKNAMMMLYMHEIMSHRVPWSGKPQWSDMDVAKIEAAFKALPVGAEESGGSVTESTHFVSNKEWKRAEKYNRPRILSEKDRGRMISLAFTQLGEAGVNSLFGGMVGGTFQGIGSTFWYILMQSLK